LPLTDFRIDYRLEDSRSTMKVTGHFEQMRRSRCYTKSAELTCTTCHNPHDKPSPKQQVAFYRSRCMTCHETDGGCRLPEPKRLAKSPQNDCVSCHMPRVDTEIPHFAFTHHRIGLKHALKYKKESREGISLKPVGDISKLPPLDRERCLGLAYLESSDLSGARSHRQQAFRILTRVYDAGIRDAEVLAALARLHWEQKSDRGLTLARQAYSKTDISAGAKINTLIVLGDIFFKSGQFREAGTMFGQLAAFRRHDVDQEMVGLCRGRGGDHKGAIQAFHKALAIRPGRPELHRLLAEAYARSSQHGLAAKHRKLSERLAKIRSKMLKSPP
jgi:predicted CXXCH cytochrome family protein